MIIKTTRYLMIIITVIVCSIYLPEIYWKLFSESVRVPMILYSPITEKFLIFNFTAENKFVDEDGKIYSRSKFEAMEPIFYFRQLVTENRMPDSLKGIALDFAEIRRNNFRIKIYPSQLETPQIKLFPMIESRSGRANLSMPEDVFRITENAIEFIDCYSNSIDEEKTDYFTDALKKENFVFPSKFIFGNPTTRKPFDEGYFIVDSEDKIFHVKMIKGMPFCKNINAPKDFRVKSMSIAENALKEFYGIIITQTDEIFIISYDNYKLIKVPADGYNTKNTEMIFKGDIFFRGVQLVNADSVVVYTLNKKYKVIDRYSEKIKNIKKETAGIVESYMFPFVIETQSESTSFLDLYFRLCGMGALIINFVLLVIAIIMYKMKGYELLKNIPDFLLIGLTGIYGLIAVIIFIPFDKTK